jgi:hypothetical protein
MNEALHFTVATCPALSVMVPAGVGAWPPKL